MNFRSGTIALVGKPNAGKSSLLNALLGEHLAAVSPRPQTTRNRIIGIHNAEGMQAVLLDTPGIHEAHSPLNEVMVEMATSSLGEVDVCTWIVDVIPLVENIQKELPVLDRGLQAINELLPPQAMVVLNKIDKVKDKKLLLPLIAAFAPREVVPVSTRSREGFEALEQVWRLRLPEGEAAYDPDTFTDSTERFIVSELIREQVFHLTEQELPYSTAVEVEKFDESLREAGKVAIHAKILVEKPGQKAIMIGKGGQMIKEIGTKSREKIAALLGCKVRLDLFVVVEPDWSRSPRMLKELGYSAPKKQKK